MAIPQGNYTAYQQTTADSKLEFGQMAKDVAKAEQDKRDRQKEEAEKLQKKQNDISSRFGKSYAELTNVITGTESIDQAFARGVGQARDMMGKIYKDIKANPSLAGDIETEMKIQNLENYSKSLAQSSQQVTDFNTKLAEGFQNGTVSNWNKPHLNISDSIYRGANLEVGVDSWGRPQAATVKVDDNGEVILGDDGLPIVESLSLSKIGQGTGLPSIVPIYNMAADAQSIGKDLAKRTQESVTGAFATGKVQTWDDMKEDARGLIQGYLGNAKSPTDEAKSIWTDVMGNENKELTQDDMNEIEEVYLNSIKPFYDSIVEENVDFGARNAAIKEANRKKELAEEQAKKGEEAVSEFTVITDEDGKPLERDYVGVAGDIRGKATEFALPTDPKTKESSTTVIGPSGNKMIVTKAILLDSGELAYEGFELRGKVTGSPIDPDGEDLGNLSSDIVRKKVGGGMDKNDNVLTSVAKAYGLQNEAELKKMLKQKKEAYKKTSGKDVSKMTAKEKIAYYSSLK